MALETLTIYNLLCDTCTQEYPVGPYPDTYYFLEWLIIDARNAGWTVTDDASKAICAQQNKNHAIAREGF